VTEPALATIRAGPLEVAYQRHGAAGGWAVMLSHGFPYELRCYDRVAPALAAAGADVVVPSARSRAYPIRRRFDDALGSASGARGDLRELIAALGLSAPIVAGFDRGGRASCLTAALWPQQVRALVTVSGYHVQNIPTARQPAHPQFERLLWY
jgi:pimeloyl-ACP methyl ester carboxylesterase